MADPDGGGYDVIGDVHGHADKLEGLLDQMGYSFGGGVWRHPSRQAIFVGDLIDRGPAQRRTIDIVRAMVDADTAQMVIGNHEFNAVSWETRDPNSSDDFVKRHSGKGYAEHQSFLAEVGAGSAAHREYIDWFRSLPLWLDLFGLRVVHACWDATQMSVLQPMLDDDGSLNDAVVIAANRKGTAAFRAITVLLKGPEVDLPDGYSFLDGGDNCRHSARMRWWDPDADTLRRAAELPVGCTTCDGLAMPALPDTPLGDAAVAPYTDDVPVVFGHYWRTLDTPVTYPTTICVDYSAAADGQPLAAYRWSGGDFTTDNLVFYPSNHPESTG